MSAEEAILPDFQAHITRIVDPMARIVGLAERWAAPVALIDAPVGFGEESWIDAVPDSLIAVVLSGAPVTCEWGPAIGVRSRGFAPTLQPAGTPNHYRAAGRLRFAQIYLPSHLLDRVADGLRPGSQVASLLREDLVFTNDAELTKRSRAYISAAAYGDGSSGLEMEARAILLVARLLSHHGFTNPPADGNGRLAPWQINRVRAILHEAPEQDILLEALAQLVGLSPFHFSRAFKASTGVPPHRYLVELRIEKARKLLETTDLPITDIAAQVDYDDPGYLARLFRTYLGTTPASYRRALRS